jgi:hypothetical protein
MNRTTNHRRRPPASLRAALEALYSWGENKVPYGVPSKLATKVEAALEAAPSATDRWHIRDTDPLTVRDENGLFVAAFNVPEDAALAALAPGMHAALSEIATKGRAHRLTKRQMIDIAADAITAGER